MNQQYNHMKQQDNHMEQQDNHIEQQYNHMEQHNSKIQLSKSELIGIIIGVVIAVIIIILALCYSFKVIKFNSGTIPPTTTTLPISTSYPWTGGEIISFWYWEGNYAALPPSSSSTETSQTITNQAWYTGVSGAQTYGSTTNNLISTTTGSFTYYGPSDTTSDAATAGKLFAFPSGLNSIIIFIGLTNATLSLTLSYAYNYTINNWPMTMVTQVYDYFGVTDITQATDANKLIAISFGGGNASTGAWTTGVPIATIGEVTTANVGIGGIYSIYQQCTTVGQTFNYTEYGTGTSVPQTGVGLCQGYTSLTDGPFGNGMYDINSTANTSSADSATDYNSYCITQFNCLAFDIEVGAGDYTNYSTSSAEDFLNLFTYIKGTSSAFAAYNLPPPLIIVTIAHSCSENIGEGVIGPLLSANPCPYDYISPQLYTCNLGTTNEYVANNNIPWSPSWGGTSSGITSFTERLLQNDKFQTYGLNMIIPSINTSSLYKTAGSNPSPYYPNLYWYESDYTTTNQYAENTPTPPPASYTYEYPSDSGEYVTVPYTAPTSISSGVGAIDYTVDTGAVGFFTTMFNSEQSNLGGYIEWLNGTCSTE